MHQWFALQEEIELSDLSVSMARDFARFITNYGSGVANLSGARRLESGDEVLLLRVATGRPQRPAYPLLREEELGILFSQDEQSPYVMSAREDFPDTPHQNIVTPGTPCSLCIDNRNWREARITYTPAELLQRIVIWFENAGKDELHEVNQPLDPYFLGSPITIILPGPVFEQEPTERCDLVVIHADKNFRIMRLEYSNLIEHKDIKELNPICIFISHEIQPDRMSRLRAAPSNLAMLQKEMNARGVDILGDIANKIDSWIVEDDTWKSFRFKSHLGILVKMPVIHPKTGKIGGYSMIAFITECCLGDVGVSIGRLNKNTMSSRSNFPYVASLNHTPPDADNVQHIQLDAMNVTASFNLDLAARMACRDKCDRRKVTMVGAGAVGSLVANSLVREGRFNWTIIDNDLLLPHNLARHTLSGFSIGSPKAEHLAYHLRLTVRDCEATGIVADVIRPNDQSEQVDKALHGADIILDASASVPVSRYLCDLSVMARRAAFFFNPTGTSAVLMVEDIERVIDLRAIEGTLYARILEDPALADILIVPPERLAYSGDCRALTTRMSSSRAQILSGLISNELGKALDSDQACLKIWLLTDDGSVTISSHRPEPIIKYIRDDWKISLLPSISTWLQDMREKKLPCETGGALLGIIDIPEKRIMVMGALPPPPDSEELPNGFLRGTVGLTELVRKSMAHTLDHIRYVGEWHSHPGKCSTAPSELDIRQLAILSMTLSTDSCPGVQVIVSDAGLNVVLGVFNSLSNNFAEQGETG